MSCKKHPCDLTSTVGVCASCLRQRLSALIAAQAQLQQQQSQPQLPPSLLLPPLQHARKSDSLPPPLLFPRSVSPYVSRRQSHHTSCSHPLRFYSTPQVGPTSTSTTTNFTPCAKRHAGVSLLSNLFKSRSEKLNPDPATSCPGSSSPRGLSSEARSSSSSSSSWFSTIFSSRRKKQSNPRSGEPRVRVNRGMSPARGANPDEDCDNNCDGCGSESGYSTESSQGWKKTGTIRRGKQGQGRNVSGLAFCLSPMVRASPNRHWSQKQADLGISGEDRVKVKPHISTASLYCANRSRKLVDFGRGNQKR